MNEVLWISQLLDLHLDLTIKGYGRMSKYSEIAAKMKATKSRLDAQLEDLDKGIDGAATKADEVIRRHNVVVEAVQAGIKEMEDAVRELEGNGEEVDDKTTTFHGVDQTDSTGH